MSTIDASLETLFHAFAARFVNRARPYAVQERDGTYRWRYETLEEDTIAAHLRGEFTLALSSSDETGRCRWLCLDVDTADGLARLLKLRPVLADMGLPGLVEASRRGGHLWLFLETPLLVNTARAAVLAALNDAHMARLEMPALELYPDAAPLNAALGHAVRLPLGTHCLTGRRYALFDEYGLPCVFTSLDTALRFLLAWPVAPTTSVLDLAAQAPLPAGLSSVVEPAPAQGKALRARKAPESAQRQPPGSVGTHSAVIRWVDAEISPLDLLADQVPEVELRRRGQGYLGWCPFHNDHAPDAMGRPGTPSLYVVHNARYGWSWRCLSTNCELHAGPMRHSFRLLQELLGLDVTAAIQMAVTRWPEAGAGQHERSAPQ